MATQTKGIWITNNLNTVNEIYLQNYLPKTEYLYGNDFNIAKKRYNIMMEGRLRSIDGWWSDKNNSAFTLPYSRIQLFARTLIRSNIKSIQKTFKL